MAVLEQIEGFDGYFTPERYKTQKQYIKIYQCFCRLHTSYHYTLEEATTLTAKKWHCSKRKVYLARKFAKTIQRQLNQ